MTNHQRLEPTAFKNLHILTTILVENDDVVIIFFSWNIETLTEMFGKMLKMLLPIKQHHIWSETKSQSAAGSKNTKADRRLKLTRSAEILNTELAEKNKWISSA